MAAERVRKGYYKTALVYEIQKLGNCKLSGNLFNWNIIKISARNKH